MTLLTSLCCDLIKVVLVPSHLLRGKNHLFVVRLEEAGAE